ncbi:MAG: hypothetical protein WCP77_15240, partial [Roseococcus sp.]
MQRRDVIASLPVLVAAGLSLFFAPSAQALEYDGNWQFSLSCAANGAQPAFTDRFTAPIIQNSVTRTRSARTAQGLEDISRFTGRVEGTQMTAVMERSRGAERWAIRFAGPATSDRRFDLAGGIFLGDRQLRSCQMVAEALSSAPGSLAATAPTRAAASQTQLAETRTQLAAAQAALVAAQESAEARADALQTELDLARFEGAAMRNELTLRMAEAAAQRADLEARLRAAEALTLQAQAALAQAVATATTEIGQRDQRISAAAHAATAAAAQRSALETRLTAAEAATAQ